MIDGGTTAATQPAKSNANALRLRAMTEVAFGLRPLVFRVQGFGVYAFKRLSASAFRRFGVSAFRDSGVFRLRFKALVHGRLSGRAPFLGARS